MEKVTDWSFSGLSSIIDEDLEKGKEILGQLYEETEAFYNGGTIKINSTVYTHSSMPDIII